MKLLKVQNEDSLSSTGGNSNPFTNKWVVWGYFIFLMGQTGKVKEISSNIEGTGTTLT